MHNKKIQVSFFSILTVVILTALDQWTKQLAVFHLSAGEDYVLLPQILQFHYLQNTGAAFSLFENRMLLFYIVTPCLCLLMGILYYRLSFAHRYLGLQILLLFLISGALGNFIDRIRYQYVIDFIYFSIINFPVFNVADIYVTGGVIGLFLLILFVYSEEDLNYIIKELTFWKKVNHE